MLPTPGGAVPPDSSEYLGDRTQGVVTDALDLPVDEDLDRFVQVPEYALPVKLRFTGKFVRSPGQKPADGFFPGLQELETDGDIGRKLNQPADRLRLMKAGNRPGISALEQNEHLLEKRGEQVAGDFQTTDARLVQAGVEDVPPPADDPDAVKADVGCKVGIHARIMVMADYQGFARIVYS